MNKDETANQQSFRFDQAAASTSHVTPPPSDAQQAKATNAHLQTEISARETTRQDLEDLRSKAQQAQRSAEALGRWNDPGAEFAFNEAETLVLRCADFEIHMRFYESYGRYLEGRGAIVRAEHCYFLAWRNAKCLSVVSDSGVETAERLLFDYIRVQNLQDASFKNLLRAAEPTDSPGVRSDAWFNYRDETNGPADRLAARTPNSVEEFRRRLDSARRKRNEGQ